MKLGPVTELGKRNKTSKKNDVVSPNCDVIVIFPIYTQFAAILKLVRTYSLYNLHFHY